MHALDEGEPVLSSCSGDNAGSSIIWIPWTWFHSLVPCTRRVVLIVLHVVNFESVLLYLQFVRSKNSFPNKWEYHNNNELTAITETTENNKQHNDHWEVQFKSTYFTLRKATLSHPDRHPSHPPKPPANHILNLNHQLHADSSAGMPCPNLSPQTSSHAPSSPPSHQTSHPLRCKSYRKPSNIPPPLCTDAAQHFPTQSTGASRFRSLHPSWDPTVGLWTRRSWENQEIGGWWRNWEKSGLWMRFG